MLTNGSGRNPSGNSHCLRRNHFINHFRPHREQAWQVLLWTLDSDSDRML